MFARYSAAFLIAAIFSMRCLAWQHGELEQYPLCEECRDPELMVAPGIGFDLTHTYGTAAVRFQNGTLIYVGRVDGDDQFIRLMLHYTDENSRPKRPENILDKLKDAWERAKRQRNKRRGLPATEDVGTIANILISLRRMTENQLGYNVNTAVTAVPHLPGLTEEDLEDAMEYAAMKMLRSYNYFGNVFEASAAYASLSNALCKHPEDIRSCNDENDGKFITGVLSISLSEMLLSLKMSVCAPTAQCWDIASEDHFDLGLRFKNSYYPEWRYWAAMRREMRRFLEYHSMTDRLQVFGEAASDEDFLEALNGALRDLEPRTELDVGGSERLETLSLVARGAADLAKRFQVMTWNCVEPRRCNETETLEGPIGDL